MASTKISSHLEIVSTLIPRDMLEANYLLSCLPRIRLNSDPEDDSCHCCQIRVFRFGRAQRLIEETFPMPRLKEIPAETLTVMVGVHYMMVHLVDLISKEPVYKEKNPRQGDLTLTMKHLYAQLIQKHSFMSSYGMYHANIGFPWLEGNWFQTWPVGRGGRQYNGPEHEIEYDALARVFEKLAGVGGGAEEVEDGEGKVVKNPGRRFLERADFQTVYELCVNKDSEIRELILREYCRGNCLKFESRSWLECCT